MSNSLNFIQTLSITELKQQQQSSFKIMAKTNGYWFRCGSLSGHVSNLDPKTVKPEDVLVSEVSNDAGETFWMAHKAGSAEAVVEW